VNKGIVVTAILVWLLISFVPALSAANLMRMGKGGAPGRGA
jgi:uncharacterized membrane protein